LVVAQGSLVACRWFDVNHGQHAAVVTTGLHLKVRVALRAQASVLANFGFERVTFAGIHQLGILDSHQAGVILRVDALVELVEGQAV